MKSFSRAKSGRPKSQSSDNVNAVANKCSTVENTEIETSWLKNANNFDGRPL